MRKSAASGVPQCLSPSKGARLLGCHELPSWARGPLSWSQRLHRQRRLEHLTVGLEGCRSPFNATNSIRTCLYFGTKTPPAFLTVNSWQGIANVRERKLVNAASRETSCCGGVQGGADSNVDAQWGTVALFGKEAFLTESNVKSPIVALENFSCRSESIFLRRFPYCARMVVGHENHGLSSEYLFGTADKTAEKGGNTIDTKADCVLYIPQYGTISSVNVVTSMGIALFYAYLDQHFPASRVISEPQKGCEQLSSDVEAALKTYQASFQTPLPTAPTVAEMQVSQKAMNDPEASQTPRIDLRPLHPTYYKKGVAEIVTAHKAFRRSLLQYSNARRNERRTAEGTAAVECTRFGLSVLYEHDIDDRNFGGLIRTANAFLVDSVFYTGRRRYNVVGAVGCNHYSPPVYLGKTLEDIRRIVFTEKDGEHEAPLKGTHPFEDIGGGLESSAWFRRIARQRAADLVNQRPVEEKKGTPQAEGELQLAALSALVKEAVATLTGGPNRFWLLDCGMNDRLSALSRASLRNGTASNEGCGGTCRASASARESLAWYETHRHDGEFTINLCDTEARLRKAAGDGVVLLVAQEGRLPEFGLLSLCEKILTIVPDNVRSGQLGLEVPESCGLPTQVAIGIALQRLSAVLHPDLGAL